MTQTVPAAAGRIAARAASPASKLRSIEGMRGLLALFVCFGHLGLNTAAARFGLKVKFELAVDIFFILSGFVLAKNYYFGKRTFGRLALGRIARLYPLHALTLLITLAVFTAAANNVYWQVVLQHALLIHNLGLPPQRFDLNFPSWSISVEMFLSLVFYFIVSKDGKGLYPILLIAGLASAFLASDGNLTAVENKYGVFNAGLMRGIAGFCLGCSASMITERFGSQLVPYKLAAWPLFLALVPFFLIKQWTGGTAVLFEIVAFLFVIVSVANDEESPLSLAPFVYLGAISYSIYLLHMPLSYAMEYLLPTVMVLGAGKLVQIGVILTAAILCHRTFELPAQSLLLRIAFAARKGAHKPAISIPGE